MNVLSYLSLPQDKTAMDCDYGDYPWKHVTAQQREYVLLPVWSNLINSHIFH